MTKNITTESVEQFVKRKADHIELALDPSNQAKGGSGLDRIELPHEALPDLNFEDIDISTERFDKPVATPFIVSSMTAGHAGSVNINQVLAQASEQQGWAMGVGSQRRQLSDKTAAQEWRELRCQLPNVSLFGNLGIAQLITTPIASVEALVDSLQAEAMIIHANPLQEVIQPEGTPRFKGCWHALEKLCKKLSVPVIVKETGCGFSEKTLMNLEGIGVAAVDVSGFGGTHWGRIEGQRAKQHPIQQHAAETFKHWGISTVETLFTAVSLEPNYEIWGSGGVRNGLDAAKLIALGAQTVGFAKPMLQAALNGVDAVVQLMQTIEYELKCALFCTGNTTIDELQGTYPWH